MIRLPHNNEITQMIIPVSKRTYFNTNWERKGQQLCPYDMFFHPPDYNPKAARSDRKQPKSVQKNIWEQEVHKKISSTTHFMYGRPNWRIIDKPTKEFVRVHAKDQNPTMRINNILTWAIVINEGKPSICD